MRACITHEPRQQLVEQSKIRPRHAPPPLGRSRRQDCTGRGYSCRFISQEVWVAKADRIGGEGRYGARLR